MEQTLLIHTNNGNYPQYQKLPDTSTCSTWKILCGQGVTHVKDFASLPSISTPGSSVRAADPTQRPNFPKSQASDRMGKLKPACKAVLQCLGSEIRHAQDTRDRLSQSTGTQQQWTNKLDPDNPWGKTVPHAANTTQPEGSRSYGRCDPGLGPTGITGTRHWTHGTHCTAYSSGWEVWKQHAGPRHVMPRSTQTCWGVSEGANAEPLQCPGGSAPLPCALGISRERHGKTTGQTTG